MQRKSSEVYLADDAIVTVTREDIEVLKQAVLVSPRGRVRLCAHPSSENRLHEMIIALRQDTYVRPHKHLAKSESFHVIEGRLDVVLFHEDGTIDRLLELGDLASGLQFYYRLDQPVLHTVIIRSPVALIHETTNGPFQKGDAITATWAPGEEDTAACRDYMAKLETALSPFKKN